MKPSAIATLDVLRARGSAGLTSLEAVALVGTSRVAARVQELREAGCVVVTDWETTAAGARIARYRLVEQPRQLEAFR